MTRKSPTQSSSTCKWILPWMGSFSWRRRRSLKRGQLVVSVLCIFTISVINEPLRSCVHLHPLLCVANLLTQMAFISLRSCGRSFSFSFSATHAASGMIRRSMMISGWVRWYVWWAPACSFTRIPAPVVTSFQFPTPPRHWRTTIPIACTVGLPGLMQKPLLMVTRCWWQCRWKEVHCRFWNRFIGSAVERQILRRCSTSAKGKAKLWDATYSQRYHPNDERERHGSPLLGLRE